MAKKNEYQPRNARATTDVEVTLEDHYIGHALTGILSAQNVEPDLKWVCKLSERVGYMMAASSRKRRKGAQ